MKNLSTVLMVLAASGTYVTALPTRTYGASSALEARDPTDGLSPSPCMFCISC